MDPLAWFYITGLMGSIFLLVRGLQSTQESSPDADPIRPFIPKADVKESCQILVRAPARTVFEVAQNFDLQSISVVRAIFRMRELYFRVKPIERSRPKGLVEETKSLGWGVLAYRAGRTLVMGSATRPWFGEVKFRSIPPDEFSAFSESDYVKIVWTLEADPIDAETTRFRTQTRVVATDENARNKFRRYWLKFGIGIRLIRWFANRAIRREAERRVANGVEALLSESATSVGQDQLRLRWDSLPEPIRRYLGYAIRENAPAIRVARLEHGGTFRTAPNQRWLSIGGKEYFTAGKPGFVWNAAVQPIPLLSIRARDSLLFGRGNMLVRFLSIFTIADASGPEIDQGARLRWLAECAWFPYAFAGDAIEWESIDNMSARAKLKCDGLPVAAVFEVDEDGKLRSMHAERYRDIGGGRSVLTPWRGEYARYGEFGGFRVPTAVEVFWEMETGSFSYARFEITSLEYQ